MHEVGDRGTHLAGCVQASNQQSAYDRRISPLIDRDTFDSLLEAYSTFSSWAVWARREAGEPAKARVGDLSVLDPDQNAELLGDLNPSVVLLGLNASSRGVEMKAEPWRNFHDPSGRAQDYKIRFAFRDTPYWGAYMTDVFTDLPETDSKIVRKWRAEHPEAVATHLARLEHELAALDSNPLILVFGHLAYSSLTPDFRRSHRVVRIDHYSRFMNQERYREKVLGQIAAATV